MADPAAAEYSGLIFLYHNLTKDVIIQWTGSAVDQQKQRDIRDALFIALKGWFSLTYGCEVIKLSSVYRSCQGACLHTFG